MSYVIFKYILYDLLNLSEELHARDFSDNEGSGVIVSHLAAL